MQKLAITGYRQAELIPAPDFTEPVPAGHVRGRTVISLVSPGTELNYAFLSKEKFPKMIGYACVFKVTEMGEGVNDLAVGSLVFASGNHCESQQAARKDVVPIPDGLAPEHAVFARLIGVSMSTLTTTAARPPAHVLVTGLGPVGNLAAQLFAGCGYQVTVVDPVEQRRETARQIGLTDVRATIEDGPVDIIGQVMLHIECSGHEKAVLDGAKSVRKGGEVVLVGVPWQRRIEIYAFELLHLVFHRYIHLRSGWEWEVPAQPTDFVVGSLSENYLAAINWIASDKIRVDGMASSFTPHQAQKVYEGLLNQSLPTPSAIFDWRKL